MRSSSKNGADRRHTYARRAAKALVFVFLCVALDVGITLALEPYGTAAEVTWYDYRASSADKIDTIIVGSSFAQRNIDPLALDKALGCSSFSLATPAQSIVNSQASIESAYGDHHIDRAIMLIGPETMQGQAWFPAQVTFTQAKCQQAPANEVVSDVARIAFDANNFPNSRSITWALPWFHSCVDLSTPSEAIKNVSENVRNRLAFKTPVEASAVINPTWIFMGKGHGGYEGTLDFESASKSDFFLTNDLPLLSKNVSELVDLISYAKDRGIRTYVIVSPRPAYATLMHAEDGFASTMAELESHVTEAGATYLDLNLARADFYRPAFSELTDGQHFNVGGAERLSATIAELVSMHEAGRDVSPLFYSYADWDELIASYDDVELVYLEQEKDDSTRTVTYQATAIAQPGLELEYLFEVRDEGGAWEAARPWGNEPTLTCDLPEGHGTMEVRVSVRPTGTQKATRTHRTTTDY